jgi:anti-sigma-K factor RskA
MTDMSDHTDDCRARDEQIDAYVDGSLSDIERRELEGHLRVCPRCGSEVAATQRLVTRARALPRELPPSRDRWSELRSRTSRAERQVAGWRVARLAAAIVVAAALSSAVTYVAVRGERGQGNIVAVDSPPAAASLARIEGQYTQVTRELAAELDARREELSPEAVATVERSLAVIDTALAEARAALALEPDNPMLARMLAATYEQKLDLLRRATRLSPSS